MTAILVIRLIASLGLCPGLVLLSLRWRNPKGVGRWAVAAGWALVVAGLAGWTVSGHGDVALSDAVTLLMVVALVVIAGHAATTPAVAKAARDRARLAKDGLSLGRGYWGRVAARLLGCVAAAPAAGMMIGALTRAWTVGDPADRLMLMATVAMLVTSAAWVMQLMSARPWRMLGVVSTTATVAAGLVYIPLNMPA